MVLLVPEVHEHVKNAIDLLSNWQLILESTGNIRYYTVL